MSDHRPGTAALWMLLAGLMFALDAGLKWIANSYSPFQVATLRQPRGAAARCCCGFCFADEPVLCPLGTGPCSCCGARSAWV